MYYCLRTTRAHIRTPKNMTYFHFILDPFKNFSHRKQSKVKQSQIRLNKLLVLQVKHIPRYWFCSIYACAMFYLGGIRALSSAQRAPLRLTSFFFFFFFSPSHFPFVHGKALETNLRISLASHVPLISTIAFKISRQGS